MGSPLCACPSTASSGGTSIGSYDSFIGGGDGSGTTSSGLATGGTSSGTSSSGA